MSTGEIATSLLLTAGVYGCWKLSQRLWASPYNKLPGPPSPSFLVGNMKEIWEAQAGNEDKKPVIPTCLPDSLHQKWTDAYGPTFVFNSWFGGKELYTADFKAVQHIYSESHVYHKPQITANILARLLGADGLIIVEDDAHKRLRRIMNPAFGPAQIRELTDVFFKKAIELRDIWLSDIAKDSKDTIEVNVNSWMSRLTMDVIGLAGFNYEFNALTPGPETNRLKVALTALFGPNTNLGFRHVIRAVVPGLGWLPAERDDEAKEAQRLMKSVGEEILEDVQKEIEKTGHVEETSFEGRDLLHLLVHANASPQLPANHKASNSEVLAQIPTFIVAGHETTSLGLSWTFFALAKHPEVQNRLREELLSVETDNPTMDALNSLPYLDAVLREVLRVYSPIPSLRRDIVKDDFLPLATPVTDSDGRVHHHIPVFKGQSIYIPVSALNVDTKLWGKDAYEFKPDRWESGPPEAVAGLPGIWGHISTFGSGPRSCIGYRFSLIEAKAVIFTIVRAFVIELTVPAENIIPAVSLTQKPALRGDPKKQTNVPVRVRPYQA